MDQLRRRLPHLWAEGKRPAESYDRAVRDDRESDRIKGYIENNPVKAGLVANAEDCRWWSAARKPR
jgi:hypothetical protein